MDGRARRRAQHGWTAVAIAVAVNVAAWPVLDRTYLHGGGTIGDTDATDDRPPRTDEPAPPSDNAAPATPLETAVLLVDHPVPALTLAAIVGPEDAARFGRGRARPRGAELPGARAADRGGGADGGAATWTERRDRADDAALRSQVWSSDDAYRSPRAAGRRRAASPEAVHRRPDATYGEREPRPAARDGTEQASRGAATDTGNDGAAPLAPPDADATTLAGRAGATTPARADGATARSAEAARVDLGAAAVDVTRRGPAAGDRAVAAASDQRRPDPYDLTPPRAGGARGEGVAGPIAAPGMVADGWRAPGTAASRWGDSDEDRATYATRSNPYFLALFRRLDDEVVFPRDLALGLKSGRVIASATLRADGRLTAVQLHAGSGYRGFDDELVRALRQLGSLGPVPSPLLRGRAGVRVLIPYTFKNQLIR